MEGSNIEGKIAEVIGGQLALPDLQLEAEQGLAQLKGWDSLVHTEIMIKLEEEFEIEYPEDRIYSCRTAGELIALTLELCTEKIA